MQHLVEVQRSVCKDVKGQHSEALAVINSDSSEGARAITVRKLANDSGEALNESDRMKR